jgi:predicted membrane channel-forming protein YqfA (hemolysin III family)
MSAPTPSASPDARRARLVGLLALAIAAVLLVSSVTWFTTGQTVVGVGQLVLGVVLAVVGAVLYRRSQRR